MNSATKIACDTCGRAWVVYPRLKGRARLVRSPGDRCPDPNCEGRLVASGDEVGVS